MYDAPASAGEALRPLRISHQTPQQSLGFFDLGAVRVAQTAPPRIEPPPALEAPEALLGHPQTRDPGAGAPELARLEVEKALEARGLPGAVGLALAAVEEDHDRRTRADLVVRAHRPAARGTPRRWAPVGTRIRRRRAARIAQRRRALGLSRGPLGTWATASSAARPASR